MVEIPQIMDRTVQKKGAIIGEPSDMLDARPPPTGQPPPSYEVVTSYAVVRYEVATLYISEGANHIHVLLLD